MSDEIFKMQWFVDAYKNNELNYMIAGVGKKKGTVVLPTGAGKSGVVYSDIVYHINNAKDDEKIIFNISAPILKLEAQLLNDFFSCVKKIFPERVANGEFMFFINSSADGNNYKKAKDIDVDDKRFYEIDKFKSNKKARFAIVASCHKSLYKFASMVKELKNYATVVTYIDEAHLVVNETIDQKSEDKLTGEAKARFEVVKELCSCDYIYAVTATPDKTVTKLINDCAGVSDNDYHIIDISAQHFINNNIILPPRSGVMKVATGDEIHITSPICDEFMKQMKRDNPDICHKILVTCQNSDHLLDLQKELATMGYKVFATCCREGATTTKNCVDTENTNESNSESIDEVKFIEEVDNYDGDCFVLHIKQLIQGIDINTLTDCIIYNSRKVNDGVKRTLIQTIGRILRPIRGERGMDIDNRKKKYGNVLFVIGDENFDDICRQMGNFLLKYYGQDGIKSFTKDVTKPGGMTGRIRNPFSGNSHFGDDLEVAYGIVIERLKACIEEYVKGVLVPKIKWLRDTNKKNGITNDPAEKVLANELAGLKKTFSSHYSDSWEIEELLKDAKLMTAVTDLFKKYKII